MAMVIHLRTYNTKCSRVKMTSQIFIPFLHVHVQAHTHTHNPSHCLSHIHLKKFLSIARYREYSSYW